MRAVTCDLVAGEVLAQASVGLEVPLPALVGALLGSTTVRPGRVDVWGTVVGAGIAGCSQRRRRLRLTPSEPIGIGSA